MNKYEIFGECYGTDYLFEQMLDGMIAGELGLSNAYYEYRKGKILKARCLRYIVSIF